MMATTHALAGLCLGVATLFVAPEHAPAAMLAGFAGGLFPDLDLYGAHRKTLHFPVYYGAAAVAALAVAVLAPSMVTVALAVFLLAAAIHAAADALGGGLEHRPWECTSEEAVYSHYHRRWIRPRRWVPYDGAPSDLALAAGLAIPPVLLVESGVVRPLVVASLVVSVVYTLLRKRLADLADEQSAVLPARLRPYVPYHLFP